MTKYIILFLKGIIIGIGKMIPGVSGSFLAILLGVYEESLTRLNCFLKNIKSNVFYFVFLVAGILISIVLGSHVILYFYHHYYLFTMVFFIGLLISTFPQLNHKYPLKSKNFPLVILFFLILTFLFQRIHLPTFQFQRRYFDYLFIFFLGGIEVFTTLIPGISSTATYMMLGSYEFILNLFANPFYDVFSLLSFGLGFLIGFVFLVKAIFILLKRNSALFWVIIYSFLIYAMYFLVIEILDDFAFENVFACFLLLLLGFQIGTMFSKESF